MRRILFVAVMVMGAVVPTWATAAPTQTATGSSADAYGLFVGVTLLAGNVPVNVAATPRSTQDAPPGGAPATANVAQVGPAPSDGSVVQNVSALVTSASATAAPVAAAKAQVANVALLAQAGVPTVSATVLEADSTSTCTADPTGAGSQFVNLKVGPVAVPANPAPNTVINLGALVVVVNEQHPAADGRGLVVNALHIYSTAAGSGLLQGDIVVAHALSTVLCANGAGTTGSSSPIMLHKTASVSSVHPGDAFTYTATITNTSKTGCLVNSFTDHLPQAFTFGSTSGGLGTKATTTARPGGGQDVTIVPSTAVTIAPGASLTQTLGVTTRTDAAPGVYANDLDLYCSDLGEFVKGLDAPVEVLGPAASTAVQAPEAAPPLLPRTGGLPPLYPAAAAVSIVTALTVTRLRRRRTVETRSGR